MRKINIHFVWLLVVIMLVGGAGQAFAETAPALAEIWPEFATPHKAKIVCFEMGWTGPESELDFVTPELAARTNFTLEYEPMTLATDDELNQKLNLMVAGGDIPDIFFGSPNSYSRSIYSKLGEAGKIWNVYPLLEEYENIYNLLTPELIMYRDDPSTIYFVPTQTGRGNDELHNMPHGPYARVDFCEKLGIPLPTTPEELYDYLVRCRDEIKEVDGQSIIGYTLGENLSGLDNLIMAYFGARHRTQIGLMPFDVNNNYKVQNYAYTDSDEFMRAAKFVNKLFQEGLIDRDSLTAKTEQAAQKISAGRVAAHGTNVWEMNNYSDNAKAVVPELMYSTLSLYDRANGLPLQQKWTNGIYSWSALTLSKNMDEETVRHFLAMLDYLATTDGQLLVQAGIEGRSYTFNDEGHYMYTDEFKQETDDLDWNKAAARGVFYWQQLVMNLPAFEHLMGEYPELVRADNMAGWQNIKEQRFDLYDPDMLPTKDYYFVPGPIEVEKMPAIDDARLEMLMEVLVAGSESEVETIVHNWAETCRRLGIDEIIQERQDWIDNFDISLN